VRKIDLNNFTVARSETARDINRRIVLNLIRRHQPISRAGLARRSGLQRSTVSSITEQLITERWVIKGASGHLPRGRKPTFLHLNDERAGIVGVDIQPGTTTLAVAGIDAHFLAQESMSTGRDPVEFVNRLGRRISDLIRAHPKSSYEGIGVSLPGRIDIVSQKLTFAPSLGWGEIDIKSPLQRATGLPVELENAANACALAELWSGRHTDGVGNLLAVTISDDIGVGMIINGQLIQGSTGVAGEFGHVALDPNGPPCRCGNRGCWEVLASNAAAVRYYAQSATVRKGEVGSKSNMATVAFGDILRLAEQGDPKACKALDQMGQYLGAGLAMLVTGLAPEVLVVVGDITRAWNRVGPMVDEAVKSRSFTQAGTRIVSTDPDAQPRLRGTIALVLQKHFGAPFVA
jgi:predicted NBD/HSP70 family sugar kinase